MPLWAEGGWILPHCYEFDTQLLVSDKFTVVKVEVGSCKTHSAELWLQ